jgi:hypothetical protein
MAQSTDYQIDNQTPASLRAELNQILSAIATQNSGSVAPTTTYPFMEWEDTSTSPATIRRRNSGNSAWIVDGLADTTNRGFITSASPTMTGTVTIPTTITSSNTTVAASTAFVKLAIQAHGTWFSPTALNGWTLGGVQYRLNSNGDVQLKGYAFKSNPPVNEIIFNLPVGFRPTQTVYIYNPISGTTSLNSATIGVNGDFTVGSTSAYVGTAYVGFNITFPTT